MRGPEKEDDHLKEYTHGGDLTGARAVWKGEVLDFSANLNPLGMPEPVRRAAEEAVGEAVHYPDPLCRDLRAAIARRDGVEPEQVLCGSGAADLIFRLAFSQRPRRALVTAPTFSEYQDAVQAAGGEMAYHRLTPENDFDLTPVVLDDLDEGVDMAFFCTPNNPHRPAHRAGAPGPHPGPVPGEGHPAGGGRVFSLPVRPGRADESGGRA